MDLHGARVYGAPKPVHPKEPIRVRIRVRASPQPTHTKVPMRVMIMIRVRVIRMRGLAATAETWIST